MLTLKLLLNNKLGKNLAKEEYLPFTTGLIAMNYREKRSFVPVLQCSMHVQLQTQILSETGSIAC